jgi:hypothetical protein
MHHPHSVRRIKHARHLFNHRKTLYRLKPPAARARELIERLPLYILHDEIDFALAGSAKIMDDDCIGMTKAARSLSFTLKAAEPFRIVAHFGRKDFDGDSIAKKRVARTEDRAHAALCDKSFYLVLPIKLLPDTALMVNMERLAIAGAKAHRVSIASATFLADFHPQQVGKQG